MVGKAVDLAALGVTFSTSPLGENVWQGGFKGAIFFLLPLGALLAAGGGHAAEEDIFPLYTNRVEPVARPEAAPALSAVCFSSRWFHPAKPSDPHDTFQTAEAFVATDFVWTYSLDPNFVRRAKSFGGKVFLAINSLVPDEPTSNTRRRGRIVDLDGNPVTAPWMRGWKESYWGCVNSPEYRASYLAYAKRAIDAGCDALQMDDPRTNLAAVDWGACFCSHCMEGFRQFLKQKRAELEPQTLGIEDWESFDYKEYLRAKQAPVGDAFRRYEGGKLKELFVEFQRESVARFFREIRAAIDAYAGRHVPFSSNNYRGSWDFPYDLFEIGMAELPQKDATPANMHRLFKEARGRGKHQIFTLVPASSDGSEVRITRCAIATSYACGGHMIVPWDVYTGPNSPRYFGTAEQYADLYRFVRQWAGLFDGYEELAAWIPGEPGPGEGWFSLRNAPDVLGVVRVRPKDPAGGVVIHLVDWRQKPEQFRLEVECTGIGPWPQIVATLFRPGQEPEECIPNWGSPRGADPATFQIPALSPWGILWIRSEPQRAFRGQIPVLYSTDLYHPHEDPDDHFDLATLFALEEFDIRGIILDGGNRQKQNPGTVPVSQMLHLTGRTVPVAVGLAEPLHHPQDNGREQPEEFQQGVKLILRVLSESDRPIVIFTTGSLRDVAAAFLREPNLLRQKVSRLYVNIGDALGGQEYNVNLDPVAYRIIMKSGLPVYWCPCFAGGLWRREGGLGTYWRFRQGEVLEHVPVPLQNFFLYALRKETGRPLDYLLLRHKEEEYQWLYQLDRNMWCTAPFLHAAGRSIVEISPGLYRALPGDRTLWEPQAHRGGRSQASTHFAAICSNVQTKTADGVSPGVGVTAENMPAVEGGGHFPRYVQIFTFRPKWLGETPDGQFVAHDTPEETGQRNIWVQCFQILKAKEYDAAMKSVLRELLRNFPLAQNTPRKKL
jgi:hypothetical protein